jgi:hypothetical protein
MRFFTSDWLGSTSLRRVSLAAKGVWIEMLCLMWANTPRGELSRRGKPESIEDIASMIHGDRAQVVAAIKELIEADVADTREDGTLFSRRMVADVALSETRADAGKKGGSTTQAGAKASAQSNTQASAQANGEANLKQQAPPYPIPIPIPKANAAPETPNEKLTLAAPSGADSTVSYEQGPTFDQRAQIRQGLIRLGVESGAAQTVSLHPKLTLAMVHSNMNAVKNDKTIRSKAAVLLTRLRKELDMAEVDE